MNVLNKISKLVRIGIREELSRALLHWHVAAGVEHLPVLQTLTGCQTIVDIGANRGQFSLIARHVFNDARIFAFEPLAKPAEICRLVFRDDPKVQVIQSAVGPVSGTSEIHISARDDSSSLLPITGRQNELFPGTSESEVATVQVARLGDCLVEKEVVSPALLKIDVQGFELSALAGCKELLSLFSWIYVECSFVELYTGQALAGDVIKWLGERGFRLDGIYNVSYGKDGCAIQADFLFSSQEQLRAGDSV